MQRLLIIQATLVLIAIIATIYLLSVGEASAALFGGCVAMANSILLYRKLDSAGSMAKDNPNAGMMTLYLGVIQRFLFVLGMFAVGMKLLELNPIAMVGAFGLAQIGYMICGVRQQP
ncbi:MAG: ATP synthase subunit I [Leucothrix sp.]